MLRKVDPYVLLEDNQFFHFNRMPKVSQSADEMPNSCALFLGYLNFSAGAFDASAWKSLNNLYSQFEPSTTNGDIVEQVDTVTVWQRLYGWPWTSFIKPTRHFVT